MYLKLLFLAGVAATLVGCGGDREVSDFGTNNSPGSASISGVGLVGETLSAEVSDPDGVQQDTVAYQWYGNGNAIDGANGSTYTLTSDEGREAVTAGIQYTDNKGLVSTAVSNSITVRPLNATPALEINVPPEGATVGQTLSAVLTDDNDFSDVDYQWIGSDTGPIPNAIEIDFTLTDEYVGENISVSATYTDGDGYDEDLTSAEVGPVTPPSAEGNVVISGEIAVGEILTATVVDGNGFGAVPSINYVWQDENGTELQNEVSGQTTNDYVLQPAQLGLTVTATATYIDGDLFAETPSDTTRDFIHSFIANGGDSLKDYLDNSAVDGDIIGLDSAVGADNYEDMPDLVIGTDNVTLRLVSGSTAVITGGTCIALTSGSTGVTIDGLEFDDLSLPDPESGNCGEGEGSIKIDGTNNTFINNRILGQAETRPSFLGSGDEMHYVTVRGIGNLIERNLFEGLSTSEGKEGAAISMFISRAAEGPATVNVSDGDNESSTVQYNVFKNFLPDVVESDDPTEWDTDSNGFAVQIGRAQSRDGGGIGSHVLQYNRFDTVLNDRRVVLVQGGGNTIHGNTIVDSWGNVALEHGYGNTVSNNIIISKGAGYEAEFGGVTVSDNLDGGISFAPLGHTIVDNYVANLASNSSDRAGLHIDSETLEDSDSSSMDIVASGLDLTTVVARNSIIDTLKAIQFEHDANESPAENCQYFDYVLDVDDNLVANQSAAESIYGNGNGENRTAIILDDYAEPGQHDCALNDASDFTNNHIYSATISDYPIPLRGGGDALTVGADNIAVDGSEDGAALSAVDANGLVEGIDADAGVGVDLDDLIFIEESMVGPGSTWTAP